MCRHDGFDYPSERTIDETHAAAQQVIKEVEQELARLPPSNTQHNQQQMGQRDGPHAMLARAIQGFKDGLAAFEKDVQDSREIEAERDLADGFHNRSTTSEEEFEREEQQQRRDWRHLRNNWW